MKIENTNANRPRKLENNMDSPIDNVFLDLCEKVSPYFHEAGFTPNMITTLSVISAAIGLYYLYHHQKAKFAIFYTLGYFFDCLDGYNARKYNQMSEFGDYYDHITDWVTAAGLFYILYARYKLYACHYAVIAVSLALTCAHFGCQEVYHDNPEASPTLTVATGLCPTQNSSRSKKMLEGGLRYFGAGTFTMIMIGLVAFVKPKN